MLGTLVKLGAVAAALLSLLIGIVFFSSALTRAGLYRWHAETYDSRLIGFTRAQHYGVPWKYTFEELYKSDLTGQTAIVTGANSGIGYEAALALARVGAKVTLACRNSNKCQEAAEKMRETDPKMKGSVLTKILDTSSLASVKNFAHEYLQENPNASLDILFLNAGSVFAVPDVPCVPLSEDGIELSFATNYLGHHLLYRSLESMLQKSTMARVIQTSSCSSFDSYTYAVATDLKTLNGCSEPFYKGQYNLSYGQSKLAQVLWTKKLTRMQPTSNVFFNVFHPGWVDTAAIDRVVEQTNAKGLVVDFLNWVRKEVMWTPSEGALTGLFLAVATDQLERDNIRGKYYHPMVQEMENPLANDEDLQDRLWIFSEELIQGFLPASPPEDQGSQDQEEEEDHAPADESATYDDETAKTESPPEEDQPREGESSTVSAVAQAEDASPHMEATSE